MFFMITYVDYGRINKGNFEDKKIWFALKLIYVKRILMCVIFVRKLKSGDV